MKLKTDVYPAGDGLSLVLCPETEVEVGILKWVGQHGVIKFVHPAGCNNVNATNAIAITCHLKSAGDAKDET